MTTNYSAIETAMAARDYAGLLSAVAEAKRAETRNVLEYLWVEAMVLVHRDVRAERIAQAERQAPRLVAKLHTDAL